MDTDLVGAIFVGLMLSAGLGYLLGWLRGYDVGTAHAAAAYEYVMRVRKEAA